MLKGFDETYQKPPKEKARKGKKTADAQTASTVARAFVSRMTPEEHEEERLHYWTIKYQCWVESFDRELHMALFHTWVDKNEHVHHATQTSILRLHQMQEEALAFLEIERQWCYLSERPEIVYQPEPRR